ncbi:MAG TPA: response regulator [Spirochaetota bacterium]|nr:response regulator [Spirochaetota bacterium]
MDNGNGNIFIVDDSFENLQILYALLTDSGYNVNAMSDEDDIFKDLDEEIPDCIILDINLPDKKGLKLCSRIKSNAALMDIPVIFVSAINETDNICDAFNAGGVDYILKPFRREEVLAKVKNHVAMSRMKRRLEEVVHERTVELTRTNTLLVETVEEYRNILKDLQENETLLLTIALNIPNSYLAIIEKDYTIGFASGQEFKKIGIDPWRLIGLSIDKVFKDKTEVVKEFFNKAFSGHESSFELYFNNQYQFYKTVPLINASGEVQRILTVAENITERKEADIRIRESLHEKETLLREIHHRVKNNMQLVSSLLSLKADSSGNYELENVFRTLQSRIFSMSLVHEKLYHYKHFSKINFKEYIKELIAEIKKTFTDEENGRSVVFDVDLDNEYLSIERAIPCGLILNELVMNSFKHAFVDQINCRIDLRFKKDLDGAFSLSVKDNGTGLPENFDVLKSDSMGMVLLRELTNQLHGKIIISTGDGTEFRIVFGQEKTESICRAEAEKESGAKKILIVEDERIISTMLKKIIKEEGYALSGCVASGKEAIRFALNEHPDLVIMDIVLEDEIDGVEAAKIITGEISVPVIFLTGNSDAATLNAARGIKPYDMLTKPVRKSQLVDVIKGAIMQGVND